MAAMPPLILASTSTYRRAQLARLGLPFEAHPPACDEEALKSPALSPTELARMLAQAKAASIAASRPDAFVIGADQVVDLQGAVLGKPHTEEAAMAQLSRLSGRTHRLVTAFALHAPDGIVHAHVDVHQMTMRTLSVRERARYVAADRPLDCAGSYKIERLGIALFDRIEGADFTAIEGLPLIALAGALRTAGFPVP
jgi:septum formation protein